MFELIIIILLLAVLIKSGLWLLAIPFALIGMFRRPFGMWHHGFWHHRPPMGPGPGPMGHGFGPGPMGPRW